MMPSLRLAGYVMLGAIFWISAALVPFFVPIALLYLGVIVVVSAMDWFLSPRPDQWEITRETSERLNLGTANRITIRARRRQAENRAPSRPITITIRDEAPHEWPLRDSGNLPATNNAPASTALDTTRLPLVRLSIKSGGEDEASYEILPTRRGDWTFGDLYARYPTPLGLWWRQFKTPAAQTVRVYPDVSEVKRYELQLRLGRASELGLHRLRSRGQGTEYESLRDYTPGDEFKNINWKASARRGRLISTNYEIERDQTIIIALDCGRMMTALAHARAAHVKTTSVAASAENAHFGDLQVLAPDKTRANLALDDTPDVPLSKLDCAINATVLLSHVAASMGDSVGLLLFADGVKKWVPPRKGRLQTGQIIEALYGAQPQLVEPDYGAAYTYLDARKIRRSLVVTFTDVIDPFASRELLTASATLRRHHSAMCVAISNRDVAELAGQLPQSMNDLYEKAMAQKMLSQRAAVFENLRRQGVGILDVDASQLTIATVNRYLELKARGAI